MGTRGTGSIAHHAAAYAEDEGSRARRRLPACRPEGDPSLAGCHQPAKQDNRKIQGRGGFHPSITCRRAWF